MHNAQKVARLLFTATQKADEEVDLKKEVGISEFGRVITAPTLRAAYMRGFARREALLTAYMVSNLQAATVLKADHTFPDKDLIVWTLLIQTGAVCAVLVCDRKAYDEIRDFFIRVRDFFKQADITLPKIELVYLDDCCCENEKLVEIHNFSINSSLD